MKDKTGREISVGCVVDVPTWAIREMLSAYVVEIREGGLVDKAGRKEPALLVLQIGIPMKISPGEPAPVYIVHESDRPKSEEKARVM